MALSTVALTFSSLGQLTMDSVVHLILWPWKNSCKILCNLKSICRSLLRILISYFHFSKNGSESESGIEHKYHDLCQDWMDLINMRLSSPNYPKPYSPLEHCIWAIIAPEGHFVSLDFKEISVSNLENYYVQ